MAALAAPGARSPAPGSWLSAYPAGQHLQQLMHQAQDQGLIIYGPHAHFFFHHKSRRVCPAEDALASSLLSCMCAGGGANILSVSPPFEHMAAANTAPQAHAMHSHGGLEASAARVRKQVPPGQPAPRVVQRADGRARPVRGRAVRRACAANCGCICHDLCAPQPCLMRFGLQPL